MPPSKRSGSSHSSSRSSSSRSSSSRSRSSSSSSRSRSSHSSASRRSSYTGSSSSRPRSASSHSSHSLFGGSASKGTPQKQPIRPSRAPRPRNNQPPGYSVSGMIRHICRTHDYIYIPKDWEYNGQTYAAGYYDEEGHHYNNVVIKDTETICKCLYCDTKVKIKWDGGALLSCPQCGAPLEVEVMDTMEKGYGTSMTEQVSVSSNETAARRQHSRMIWLLGAAIIFLTVVRFFSFRRTVTEIIDFGQNTIGQTVQQPSDPANSIYVEEIGRTCVMDSDGNYYDKTSGCYFWFNTEIDPAQWQYWYEGISDNYGDYGWMEYDQYEGQWYIESDYDKWIVLPETYDTSGLWHFADAYTY